ncbi:MAG: DUF362 domain-containing protein [bacterium]|nr:DUF362 domain-containing protein [bacterium]
MNTQNSIYIAKCPTYDPTEIRRIMLQFFDLCGGVQHYFKPGMEVLLKPNLCLAHPPERGITTHPAVLEQIIAIIHQNGAKAVLGDNPIGKEHKEQLEEVWEKTGMNELVKRTGCGKSMLDSKGFQEETVHLNGKSFSFFVSRQYLEADLVINVPKFKTHALTGLTGAVKNTFGIIPGRSKVHLHRFAPDLDDFSCVVADVHAKRVPELTILDAITGIEGEGPGAKGITRDIGTLIISDNSLLTDRCMAIMMGLDPGRIGTNKAAEQRGLEPGPDPKFHFDGFASLEDCVIPDFILPRTLKYANSEVIKKYFDLAKFKVGIKQQLCTQCRLCMGACPVQTIALQDQQVEIAQAACIQCMCCLEICPQGAIDVQRSKFYRDLKKIRKRTANKSAQ